jgi:predicted dienelactone hydrolase
VVSHSGGGASRGTGFTLRVAPDAAPVPGRYGLVVISHGSGGSSLGHHDTAGALARAGWVVAAPMHPGNNALDDSGAGTAAVWLGRPVQLSAAIDAVLADDMAGTLIDRRRIRALGFSAGGYTVLAALSGRADPGRIVGHCREHGADPFCRYAGEDASLTEAPKLDRPPEQRIGAAVIMAPVGVLFDDKALSDVTVPVRLYRAERDEQLGHPFHAERVRVLLPSASDYSVVENAGHFAFLALVPVEQAGMMGPAAYDPPGFDRAGFHERLNREIAGFLDKALPPW